ncbi:unnamed protein product [Paramecium primaurelia]|uniref:Cyclic nucleotide-binding domain-containing protein n=1 Tax=Paramecium primaurelia TaxID=5886 RepID=A0A8S1NB29_PARPR|nr:unnamed protein product [Paramecium primaurelia]
MDSLEWFKKTRMIVGEDLYQVIKSKMQIEQHSVNEVLTKIGDKGNKFYVILKGLVGVFVRNEDQLTMINVCKEGEGMGELSIMSNKSRMATLVCLTDCVISTLTASQYKRYVMQNDIQRINNLVDLCDKVSLFNSLNRQVKIMLMLCMKEVEIVRKQIIYKQAQQAKNLYIIIEGSIKLCLKEGSKQKTLCVISDNEIFGDLMGKEVYQETAECESQSCRLLMISRKTLQKVLQSTNSQGILEEMKQIAHIKYCFRTQLKESTSLLQYEQQNIYEPFESTRTLFYSNGIYLSDKMVIRSNRHVMQSILNRSKIRRPVICVSVIERKSKLDSGLRLSSCHK